MLLIAVPEILVERNKHNDSRGHQRKYHICCNFFAAGQEDIAEESPKERDAYGLTICYLSACHAYFLFFMDWERQEHLECINH